MARSINNVNLSILICDSCILRKNSDSSFSFDIIGIHNSFSDFLISSESSALL